MDAEEQECCLNPKDFITFKTEIDLLCDDEIDVFKRWGILEDIQKTKVHKNINRLVHRSLGSISQNFSL